MDAKDVANDPSAWYLGVGGVTLGGLFLFAIANALKEHISAIAKRILFGNSEEIAKLKALLERQAGELADRKQELRDFRCEFSKLEDRVIETEKHGGRIEAILEANHLEAIRAITDLSGNIAALVSRVDQLHLAAAANATATAHTALHASQQGA
jgi:predicted  nucleic acid-binding Zn-ribbon protein